MITRFGNAAEKWFSQQTLNLASELQFDETTKKIIDKSTCDYAPLTHLYSAEMTDDQIMRLLDTGTVEEFDRMQIEDNESLESDDDDDDGPFSFQKKYVFQNLTQMFPDEPAINIGPHKEGLSVSSMKSGISDAVNKLNDTERQTGEIQNG